MKNPEDEQAIRETVEAYRVAFEKGDLDGVMLLYAPDAEYVDAAGEITRGRTAIAALFKKNLAASKGAVKFHVSSLNVLESEVALENGITERIGPDGSSRKTRYNAVWAKTSEGWVIVQAHDLPGNATSAGF
jgi:uncharacterized protein (TIGR02246 family)